MIDHKMHYEMLVDISKGGEQKHFEYDCYFSHDDDTYGNSWYCNIENRNPEYYNPMIYDLRYNREFRSPEPYKWLEAFARSKWTGENGAWTLDNVTVNEIS